MPDHTAAKRAQNRANVKVKAKRNLKVAVGRGKTRPKKTKKA